MIKVEMTFASAEEAAEAMSRLAYDGPGESGEVAETGAPQQRRRRRTKAEMEAARAAETTEATAASAAPEAVQPADTGADFLGEDTATGRAISDTPEDRKEPEPKPLTKEEAEAKFKNEVRPALGKVMQAKGQDAARKLLNDFGFAKLTDMPSERFDEFVNLCAAA